MIEVTVDQASAQMEELLDRAIAGEEVVLMRSGRRVARLVPYAPEPLQRVAGRSAGQIAVIGDFNEPLPDDVVTSFES